MAVCFGLCMRGMTPALYFKIIDVADGIVVSVIDIAVPNATAVKTKNGIRIL